MDSGTVASFVDEMGDVGKGERAALKYSALESPETQAILQKVKSSGNQSPYARQLLKGQEVEKEHRGTINWLKKNPDAPLEAATRSISSEHVEEDPLYYDHLREMEDKYKHAQAAAFWDELQKIGMSDEVFRSLKSLPGIQRPSRLVAQHLSQAGGQVKKRITGLASHLKDVPEVWTSAKHSGFFEQAGTKVQKTMKGLAPKLKERFKHTGQDIKDWAKDRVRPSPGGYA